MKLHLGCGKRRLPPPWINVDADSRCEPDVVADAFTLEGHGRVSGWVEESVDVIYACHVLEHAGRHEYRAVLRRWHEVLKLGGTLRLSVPDLGWVFATHMRLSWGESETGELQIRPAHKLDEFLGFLYGGQRTPLDYHKMGWDEASLTCDLLEAGFKDIRRYDRDKTEHADVDDASACYLPHIRDCKDMVEYRKGRLLSLNVECTK